MGARDASLALDLIALGEEGEIDGAATFGVRAGGAFFPIAPVVRSGRPLMRLAPHDVPDFLTLGG